MLDTILKIVGLVGKRKAAMLLVILGLCAALLEAAGIGLVLPFLAVVNDAEALDGYPSMQRLIGLFPAHSTADLPLVFGSALLVFFLAKNVFLGFYYRRQANFVFDLEASLCVALIQRFVKASGGEREGLQRTEMLRIVSTEVNKIANGIFLPLLNIAAEGMVVVLTIALLMSLAPLSALWVAVAFVIAAMGLILFMRKMVNRARDLRTKATASVFSLSEQITGAVREIRVFRRADYFLSRYDTASRQYAEANVQFAVLSLAPRLVIESLAVGGLVGLAVAAHAADGGRSLLPILAVTGLAAVRLMPSATRILGALNTVRFFKGSLDVVMRPLGTTIAADAGTIVVTASTHQTWQSLQLDGVSHRYAPDAEPALRAVNLRLDRGEINAVVGPSGAGKTTLLEILCGMLKPQSGSVSINGQSPTEFDAIKSGTITIVPQDFFLLSDSIRRNVSFAIEDEHIDDARVWAALERASLATRVNALTDGLDTIVGEAGVSFSGGERQRMAIARALYQAPDLMILDEATSALDVATEREVMQTLAEISKDTIVVFVTHRLATLAECRNVAFLSEGVLVVQGPFPRLLNESAEFKAFVSSTPSSGPAVG